MSNTMNGRTRRRLRTSYICDLIKKFEEAVRNHEMKGSAHPGSWNEIERDYREAKRNLYKYIKAHWNLK